ncbi:metastasis-suppressor KiSS-1 [Rhinatrema bivittatum]|uniref:metastasis-suppressor KiSS-1 n=1 Tax=Rhinatrema bivittatum TaxID=194408 RepID=UPI0011282722|nr:metastasis-suppressor KiSS-1 [Rhinatrema bivittatum]
MSPSTLLLLFLLLNAQLQQSSENLVHIQSSKVTAQAVQPLKWQRASSCLGSRAGPGQVGQHHQLPLLCKRKQEMESVHSRVIPAPEGTLLVEREKDLSTYNWNTFGLRYGKRQTGNPKTRGHI